MSGVLVIDKGNQSCRIAEFERGMISRRWYAIGEASREMVTGVIEEVRPARVAFSSVVPEWTEWFRRALGSLRVERVLEAGARIVLPFEMRVEFPDGVGPDRICAAAGAFALGHREAVIVDAGTAVTVDLLSEGGFLGGSIFPGLDLLARSLGDGTASLPEVSPGEHSCDVPGINTRAAIACGLKWGYVGAVKELIAQSVAVLSPNVQVIVTGGWADAVAAHLARPVLLEPDLNLKGLHYLLECNSG